MFQNKDYSMQHFPYSLDIFLQGYFFFFLQNHLWQTLFCENNQYFTSTPGCGPLKPRLAASLKIGVIGSLLSTHLPREDRRFWTGLRIMRLGF